MIAERWKTMMNPEAEKQTAEKVCISCQSTFAGELSKCPHDGSLLAPLQKDELIGTVILEKYEILSVLGSGGMGVVYKARHSLLDRPVAVKVLRKIHLATPSALKRFQLEAQAASALSMPHIIRMLDFGILGDGQPYMIMEYLEGRPLNDVIDSEGRLPIQRAIHIFIQIASALAHAHTKGVIHRDIKPSNIVLIKVEDESDYVKIVDFGIAKLLNPVDQDSGNLTRTGEIFGSALYMSPEQCRAQQLDGRTDIYSLGCLMYRALSGKPLFEDGDMFQLVCKHLMEPPASFKTTGVDIPDELEAIVMKTLAKDPAERYQSMQDLVSSLEQFERTFTGTAIGSKQQPAARFATTPTETNKVMEQRPSVEMPGNPQPKTLNSLVRESKMPVIPHVAAGVDARPAPPDIAPISERTFAPPAPQSSTRDSVSLAPASSPDQSPANRPAGVNDGRSIQVVVSKRLLAGLAAIFILGAGAAIAFFTLRPSVQAPVDAHKAVPTIETRQDSQRPAVETKSVVVPETASKQKTDANHIPAEKKQTTAPHRQKHIAQNKRPATSAQESPPSYAEQSTPVTAKPVPTYHPPAQSVGTTNSPTSSSESSPSPAKRGFGKLKNAFQKLIKKLD
jgi:serine/threonine protein kinase